MKAEWDKYSPVEGSERSLCGFPGCRSPFPALGQLSNSLKIISPSCPALQDLLGCAGDLQVIPSAIPRLWSPWNLGWNWNSHLSPDTDAAAGRDGVRGKSPIYILIQ